MSHKKQRLKKISNSMAMRNGFHNKKELEYAMQYPLYGLQAVRFGTENVNVLCILAEDLEEIEIKESELYWSEISKYCRFYAKGGAKVRIKPNANIKGRYIYEAFDEGDSFFERIMKYEDVVDIDLVYDTDFWEKLHLDSDKPIFPKKFINI